MAASANKVVLNDPPRELDRIPLVENNRSVGWISDAISRLTEDKVPLWWWLAFVPSFIFMTILGLMLAYQISTGVGVWGNHHPEMWGWDIINFVWWIGIGFSSCCASAGARASIVPPKR
jgi:hypothetical protein